MMICGVYENGSNLLVCIIYLQRRLQRSYVDYQKLPVKDPCLSYAITAISNPLLHISSESEIQVLSVYNKYEIFKQLALRYDRQ